MRAALALLVFAAPMPAGAASDGFAAFDRSVAATKQAMMADPEDALASALNAVAIAHRLPASPKAQVAILQAEWLHGEALLYLNKLTEAAPLVEATLREAERVAPNTKLHGDLLRSHGAVAAGTGNNVEALRDYLRAHAVFRAAGVARSQAISLQDIGLIYFDAGDYERALTYFDQSAEAYGADTTLRLTMHNNRAEVLRKQKRFAEAAASYRAALVEARKLGGPLLQVRILTNLAGALAEAHQIGPAQAAASQAMALAGHGEAAGWQPFVYGVAARIAFERGDLPRARQLIARSFAGVDLNKSEMLYREYHLAASRIYEASGDEERALAHLKAFQRLDGEAQSLTASAASQLLAARFDFANQNLKISKLKQGQLQRDIEIERQKNGFRLTLLAAIAAAGTVVTALLLIGFISIRRSRNRVRDANTTLSQVNGALESALQAKTEFLATTSHEIRTPLNGILGMTQVLLADHRVEADVRERIAVVHGAGETMRALVDDILDVAKMESGKLTVTEEPTELRRILHDVGRLWQGQAEAKGLTLTVEIDDAPERILSDGSRVRQIVFNLLSNALKFTMAGAVALRARSERAADGTETVVIAVADSGVGIPADQLGCIFEAFRQVDGGVTRQFGGTGLGLAICRNLAEALGGDIGVESVLGVGSTFTVRLPLRAVVQAPSAASPEPSGSGLGEASLLIVEGDPAQRSLLALVLATEVAAVTVVADCDAASAALAAGRITHVLVGTATAGDDRVATLRSLAGLARSHDAHCTLLVAPEPDFTVADAMMVGATQIVVKPIPTDRLVEALHSLYRADPETIVMTAGEVRAAA